MPGETPQSHSWASPAGITHLPVLLDNFLHRNGSRAHEIVGAQVVVVIHLDLASGCGGSVRRAEVQERKRAEDSANHEHLREVMHWEAERHVPLGVEVLADVLGLLGFAADAIAVGDGDCHIRVTEATHVHLHHPSTLKHIDVERPDALFDHSA